RLVGGEADSDEVQPEVGDADAPGAGRLDLHGGAVGGPSVQHHAGSGLAGVVGQELEQLVDDLGLPAVGGEQDHPPRPGVFAVLADPGGGDPGRAYPVDGSDDLGDEVFDGGVVGDSDAG